MPHTSAPDTEVFASHPSHHQQPQVSLVPKRVQSGPRAHRTPGAGGPTAFPNSVAKATCSRTCWRSHCCSRDRRTAALAAASRSCPTPAASTSAAPAAAVPPPPVSAAHALSTESRYTCRTTTAHATCCQVLPRAARCCRVLPRAGPSRAGPSLAVGSVAQRSPARCSDGVPGEGHSGAMAVRWAHLGGECDVLGSLEPALNLEAGDAGQDELGDQLH